MLVVLTDDTFKTLIYPLELSRGFGNQPKMSSFVMQIVGIFCFEFHLKPLTCEAYWAVDGRRTNLETTVLTLNFN